jgi:hypothetical protein
MIESIEDTQAGGDFFDLLDKSGYNLQSFLDKLPATESPPYPREQRFWPFIIKTELLLPETEES